MIVRAEGDNFSYGVDLKQISDSPCPSLLLLRRKAELGARLMRTIGDIHQPTICVIQDVATGGGTCIASACDFRIAAHGARMGYGEVKLGINLMWNALPLCAHLVGSARDKQMIKRSINRVACALDEAIMHADVDQWLLALQREDFTEAVGASREKRPADSRGN